MQRSRVQLPSAPLSFETSPSASTSKGFLIVGTSDAPSSAENANSRTSRKKCFGNGSTSSTRHIRQARLLSPSGDTLFNRHALWRTAAPQSTARVSLSFLVIRVGGKGETPRRILTIMRRRLFQQGYTAP